MIEIGPKGAEYFGGRESELLMVFNEDFNVNFWSKDVEPLKILYKIRKLLCKSKNSNKKIGHLKIEDDTPKQLDGDLHGSSIPFNHKLTLSCHKPTKSAVSLPYQSTEIEL